MSLIDGTRSMSDIAVSLLDRLGMDICTFNNAAAKCVGGRRQLLVFDLAHHARLVALATSLEGNLTRRFGFQLNVDACSLPPTLG